MDIIGGLSAAKIALDLAKDLREIDKSVDEAGFKLKIAELVSAVADTKVALADAKEQIHELQHEIRSLREGDLCPVCREGRLKVTRVTPHEYFIGTEFHDSECSVKGCGYKNCRQFDTNRGAYSSKSK